MQITQIESPNLTLLYRNYNIVAVLMMFTKYGMTRHLMLRTCHALDEDENMHTVDYPFIMME